MGTIFGFRRDGAFAERLWVPEGNLLPIPPEVSLIHAAAVEPAAVSLHAMLKFKLPANAGALVIGGGPIGAFAAQWLRILGCSPGVRRRHRSTQARYPPRTRLRGHRRREEGHGQGGQGIDRRPRCGLRCRSQQPAGHYDPNHRDRIGFRTGDATGRPPPQRPTEWPADLVHASPRLLSTAPGTRRSRRPAKASGTWC